MKTLGECHFTSPVGELILLASGELLVGLEFGDATARVGELRSRLERSLGPFETEVADDPAGAASRLRRYFAGEIGALDDQPVLIQGTAFEEKVWRELRNIPAGEVLSYGELARQVGSPGGARAVGAANGRNPIALFVPCHRVIAGDGSLHGYGGGLDRKRWLLNHERLHATARTKGQLGLNLAR